MSKKQIIKDIFNDKINKTDIYNEVIFKIENNNRLTLNKILKYSMITVLILAIILDINYNNKKRVEQEEINGEKIYINNLDNFNNAVASIDAKATEIDIETLEKEQPIVKEIKTPDSMFITRIYKEYIRSDVTKDNYDILTGYNIIYLDSNNDTEKLLDIFISNNRSERLRCIPILTNDIKESTINNHKIKILSYTNSSSIYYKTYYIVFFKYNNLYFDIEARNLTEEELINLIKSTLKEDTNEK